MALWRSTRPSRTYTKNICPFHDLNAKVGSQEIPGETGKFDPGVQNEAGQRLTEFCPENGLVVANTPFQQHKWQLYTWVFCVPHKKSFSRLRWWRPDPLLPSQGYKVLFFIFGSLIHLKKESNFNFLLLGKLSLSPPLIWHTIFIIH